MDSQKIVTRLKKLQEVGSMKEVLPLTNYLFPGKHCPLMGAAIAVRGIEDALIIVIGTNECTYYTKTLALSDEFGGIAGRCLSVVLDHNDVTFGSVEKTEKAFREMYDEYKPSCVFLVTTCVVEIIGDDFDALSYALSDEYQIPVMAVHTEHFKSQDHMPGIERTMTSCIEIMKEQDVNDNVVNVLGQRLGSFVGTELHDILTKQNIEVGLMMPSGCTVPDIEKAPNAKVNVVVHETALPLAKKMKQRFNTPYVLFERMADPDRTMKCYEELFNFLEINLLDEIHEKYEESRKLVLDAVTKLKGISYVYGNTPYRNFEINEFMCKLGMKPELIQLSEIAPQDAEYKTSIEKNHNPYVTFGANIAPLQHVYDVLKPNLYLGHEYALRLQKKGIAVVATDRANSLLGFETTKFLLEELVFSSEASIRYKTEILTGIETTKMGGHPAHISKSGGHPAHIKRGGM
ncbi:MAG: nitrogenase component 1 [Peptostreptococcaceae bacterium]